MKPSPAVEPSILPMEVKLLYSLVHQVVHILFDPQMRICRTLLVMEVQIYPKTGGYRGWKKLLQQSWNSY